MKNHTSNMPILILFLMCLLIEGYHTQDTNETVCIENNLSPDNETEDGIFETFITQLEKYTGIGQPPISVTLTCGSTPCTVNPNGAAIWEARMDFYLNNMMSHTNGSATTLDGCLCYSEDIEAYTICMEEVRQNMIDQMDDVLLAKFKEIVEGNCSNLFKDNCITN